MKTYLGEKDLVELVGEEEVKEFKKMFEYTNGVEKEINNSTVEVNIAPMLDSSCRRQYIAKVNGEEVHKIGTELTINNLSKTFIKNNQIKMKNDERLVIVAYNLEKGITYLLKRTKAKNSYFADPNDILI